ncbi:MAG: DNA mismatch endonuclease Vsr [Acidimicrobiia bacterium]
MTTLNPKHPPANDHVRRQMRAQPERDTRTERVLRRTLHRRGLRFRLHRRLLPESRRETDIVFVAPRVAVFVDGCFWHGCPDHATWPKNNARFWRQKIEANRDRDRETNAQLAALGWAVVRVWEHEDPFEASERIARLIKERSAVS